MQLELEHEERTETVSGEREVERKTERVSERQ